MANDIEAQLKQLVSRLDILEHIVQSQIQRIHALEQQKGVSPTSVSQSEPSFKETEPGTTEISIPSESKDSQFDPSSWMPRATAMAPQESLESQIGGNWLNKIGMVAIILGMAYFLKYAIDNEWIGEMGRVILGIFAGVGFLGWGEILQRKSYRGYAITVLGGGIAILYFSIFAAFSFYQLVPQIPALLLMVLITATAVLLALRYDSGTIAVFAIVGGFLTPAMLSTGRDNQVGLFSYILLLDFGVLALAYFKNWRALNLLVFLFTQLIFVAWSISFYTDAKLWKTEFFLTVFFFVFAVMSFLYNIVHQQKTTFRDLLLVSLNGAAYFLWTYALLESQYSQYLGFYSVLMAGTYVALGRVAYQRAQEDTYLFLIFLGLGLTSLTLAIPIQLKQNWITIGWAVEAVILSWIGFRLDSRKTRWAALLIASLVAVRLLFYDSQLSVAVAKDFPFFLNKRGFTFLVGSIAIFVMAFLYSRYKLMLSDPELKLIAGLVVAANLLILFFFTTEISQYYEVRYLEVTDYLLHRDFRSRQQLSVSALWGIYSIVLVTIGIVRKFQPIRLLAILLFAVTILKVFLVDLQEMDKLYRIIASIGLGVLLLTVSLMYQKYRNQINSFVLK